MRESIYMYNVHSFWNKPDEFTIMFRNEDSEETALGDTNGNNEPQIYVGFL